MRTTLSTCCWISVIAVALVMLLSAPEAGSASVGLRCCHKSAILKKPEGIQECFEQIKRHSCHHHAFVIVTERKSLCVSPNTKWLKKLTETGELQCPKSISYKHRYEFLDEDE